MKEKFEDRRMTGKINLCCKYDDGSVRYWTTTKEEVIAHIVATVNRYRALGYRLTLRQLHYQLVTKNWIVNHNSAYKKLGEILDDCRYGGVVDWDSIEDRGRVPHLPYYADSVGEAVEHLHDYYRRNRQEDQDHIIELWTEKDALSGILKRSTDKYHIRLSVNKGYTSSSAIYAAYQRIIEYLHSDKKVTILYFGDHDPSGLDMVRDIRDRLYKFIRNGTHSHKFEDEDMEDLLDIRAIGLTMGQVRQYRLPPNPTKMTDSRADGYIALYGTTCWEVDALDPTVLTELVGENIEALIDMEQYEYMRDEEKKDKRRLRKIIKMADEIPLDDSDADDEDED